MKLKVIPVVVLNNEEETKEKLSALIKGGLPVAEITFRTEYAPKAIEYAIKNFPDLIVGAGTVINAEQANKAIDLGVKFIVSPGFSRNIAEVCKQKGITYYPGCVTPTEIMAALEYDIKVIKFFPSNNFGGLKTIKALAGPFPQVKFMPTGGVDMENLEEFLACDKIFAVGGSFMMKGDIVSNCKRINEIISKY
jgi:2-dehydro-3-deoxyphosphogluconate aldolase/(4S)-4-hydroxy-2-oxoglutarate aldolase